MTNAVSLHQPESDYISLMTKAALLQLAALIEHSVMRARHALRMPHDDASLDEANQRLRYESPLFVKTIEIHGSVCRDMYDHAPGFAYFYTDGLRCFKAPPYCRLSQAMELSVQMLKQAKQEAREEADGDEQYDGKFSPQSIVLRDQFGHVVQEYKWRKDADGQSKHCWLHQLPTPDECHTMEKRASELASEAAVESGWDNFSTAEGLRNHAEALQRKVSVARMQLRVVR